MNTHETYDKHYAIGFGFTLLLIVGITFAWFREPVRMLSASEALRTESIARGRGIYREACTTCHGTTGEGGIVPALNNQTLLANASDDVLFATVAAGRPGTTMPAWGQALGGPLTDEDIRDLVNFLRAWEPTAPVVDVNAFEPSAARGAALFASTCFVCHGEHGAGSDIAPALNDPARLAQLEDNWYRDTITNGRPAKGMPTWGTVLSPNQIEDLVSLIAAWRSGEVVVPESSVGELLDYAIFALSNSDVEDTLFYLERAETVAFGPGLAEIRRIRQLVSTSRLNTALSDLSALRTAWPMGDPLAGEPLYRNNCMSCHGVDGAGGVGPALTVNAFVAGNTNSQLLLFLLEGRPGTAMQGFDDRLSEEELADIIALVRSWQP